MSNYSRPAKRQKREGAAASLERNASLSSLKSSDRAQWLLVTGQPGCGKTTLVKAMAAAIKKERPDLRVSGFYTDEVLGKDGKRIGFDVVTLDGKRGILSRKEGLPRSFPKTGAYSVDVDAFELVALPSMNKHVGRYSVVIIDEIGRMELHSKRFRDAVKELLVTSETCVIGAITAPIYGHRVAFCDEVSAHEHVIVRKITKKTRNAVREELLVGKAGGDRGSGVLFDILPSKSH